MTDTEVSHIVAGGIVARGAEVLFVQVALPTAAGLGSFTHAPPELPVAEE